MLQYIDGLVQERRNSIANALELSLSCINPSILSYPTSCSGTSLNPLANVYFFQNVILFF